MRLLFFHDVSLQAGQFFLSIFGRKGDAVVDTNIKAIRAGRDAK